MKGGLGNLMQQAQEMQEKMKQAQDELAKLEVTGESGAGLVKVLMTGRYDVKRVNIDDSLVSDDREMLEDLVAAAMNDAVRKIEANNKTNMANMTSGLKLPPGFKMPF